MVVAILGFWLGLSYLIYDRRIFVLRTWARLRWVQYRMIQYSTIHKYVFQLLILSLYFFRARFSKRSSSQLPEVERGTAGGGERGTLPSGPLNIAEGEATACRQEVERGTTGGGERGALPGGPLNISERVAMANKQDTAEQAPLGAEEKVQ